jgi:hypothetical protein
MAADVERARAQRWTRWRTARWSAAAALLAAPLVAMQFTQEMNWGPADFAAAAALLAGAGLAYEVAATQSGLRAYRAGIAVALATGFVLVWANLAVGIIGSEDHPANTLFYGVLAVATAGALLARLRPRGMARALVATALAQLLVGGIVLVAGSGFPALVTLVFCALWLASAWLFRVAARDSTSAPAAP